MAQSLCSINWDIEGLDDSQMVPSPNRANSNTSIFISIAIGIIFFFKCEKDYFSPVPSQRQLVESGQNVHTIHRHQFSHGPYSTHIHYLEVEIT